MKRKHILAATTAATILGLGIAGSASVEGPGTPSCSGIIYTYPGGSTTFVVPPVPFVGYHWEWASVKAGSEQQDLGHDSPIPVFVGQTITHSSGKTISHVDLCKVQDQATTTTTTTSPTTTSSTTTTTEATTSTTSTTTTIPPTTTPRTPTTTTTEPDTTSSTSTSTLPDTSSSTDPSSTTSSEPSTTSPTTTSSTSPTSSSITSVPSTPPEPAPTTTSPGELPETGTDSTLPLTVAAGVLIAAGAVLVLSNRRTG